MSNYDFYQYISKDRPDVINWKVVVLVFAGILTIIVLVTVFFIIPKYAEDYLNKRVQNSIKNISIRDYKCYADLYNCEDFATQSEAQYVLELCGPMDIHRLDQNFDGKACENLP